MYIKDSDSILNFDKPRGTVLIIYTGGTFGMINNSEKGTLMPYDLSNIVSYFPELNQLQINISLYQTDNIIDSSNLTIDVWKELVWVIEKNYSIFDGFIIIHGTDTMAYSASAMSFLIENLNKPVLFTGAQLPVSMIRTDARDNLITALEIACLKKNGLSIVNEVAIYFNNVLLRGNRAKKVESSHFDAFESPNYPILAETGINIDFQEEYLLHKSTSDTVFYKEIFDNVAIVKIFPGMTENYLKPLLENQSIKGIVLESFGSGNAPSFDWFLELLKNAIKRGVVIYNVSQCFKGSVFPNKYETSKQLYEIGVVPGYNITVEAAITKLMCFLPRYKDNYSDFCTYLKQDSCGELSF